MGGFGEPLIGALGVAALLGIGWRVVVIGERGRMGLQQRLATLAPGARSAVAMVRRGVKAGLMPMDSLRFVASEIPEPVGSEFQKALREMDLGVEMTEALQRTADRVRAPDFDFLVVTLSLQRRTGGALAEALANLSGIVRQRKQLRRKAREA